MGSSPRLLARLFCSCVAACALLGTAGPLGQEARADGPASTSASASPADAAKQAQALLDDGVALFKAGDLERARVALSRASLLVPDKPNPYRWIGLVETRLGHCQAALVAFDAFLLRVQPGDQRTIEVVTLRDRCRAELEPKVGTLIVQTTPPGADVRLLAAGDPSLGHTPIENTEMPAGSHILVVRKPGYVEISRGVSVAEKEVVRLDLVLQPVPQPRRRRYWIIGAVLGPLAAVGLGVGLGVGLTRSDTRTFPPIQ